MSKTYTSTVELVIGLANKYTDDKFNVYKFMR